MSGRGEGGSVSRYSDLPNTVTVMATRNGRFVVAFGKLPDHKGKPQSLASAMIELRVSALLSPLEARNLCLDASEHGSASRNLDDA